MQVRSSCKQGGMCRMGRFHKDFRGNIPGVRLCEATS